ARAMDPNELRQHYNQLRYQADQEAGVVAEEELRERQWMRLWMPSNRDMYRFEGELDLENGTMLKTALEAAMGRRRPEDADRSPMRRRAEAMGDVVRCALDSGRLPEM